MALVVTRKTKFPSQLQLLLKLNTDHCRESAGLRYDASESSNERFQSVSRFVDRHGA